MQSLFPELAETLQSRLGPAQQAPAASLHNTQAACQIAFREMQVVENDVSELEVAAADLVSALRAKITELNDRQVDLASARDSYDAAARAAQLEVQKTRPASKSETEHVSALTKELSPQQLEQLSVSLAEAAKSARAKEALPSDASKQDGDVNIPKAAAQEGTALPTEEEKKGDAKEAEASKKPPSRSPSRSPSKPPLSSVREDQANRDKSPSPGGSPRRSSRSPRRGNFDATLASGEVSPSLFGGATSPSSLGAAAPEIKNDAGDHVVFGEPPEVAPTKALRVAGDSDVAASRGRSASSAVSGKSGNSVDAAHYSGLADQLEEQLKAAKLQKEVELAPDAVMQSPP